MVAESDIQHILRLERHHRRPPRPSLRPRLPARCCTRHLGTQPCLRRSHCWVQSARPSPCQLCTKGRPSTSRTLPSAPRTQPTYEPLSCGRVLPPHPGLGASFSWVLVPLTAAPVMRRPQRSRASARAPLATTRALLMPVWCRSGSAARAPPPSSSSARTDGARQTNTSHGSAQFLVES